MKADRMREVMPLPMGTSSLLARTVPWIVITGCGTGGGTGDDGAEVEPLSQAANANQIGNNHEETRRRRICVEFREMLLKRRTHDKAPLSCGVSKPG